LPGVHIQQRNGNCTGYSLKEGFGTFLVWGWLLDRAGRRYMPPDLTESRHKRLSCSSGWKGGLAIVLSIDFKWRSWTIL
jgi:hypothetical protein